MELYPKEIISDYAAKKITRDSFILLFGLWQKENGNDFFCHGIADKFGAYIIYRGETGMIYGNKILYIKTDEHGYQTRYCNDRFSFCRNVDFEKNASKQRIRRIFANK